MGTTTLGTCCASLQLTTAPVGAAAHSFMRNPRFVGLKFPDMSRPETLKKKYVGSLSRRALGFVTAVLQMDPSDRATRCVGRDGADACASGFDKLASLYARLFAFRLTSFSLARTPVQPRVHRARIF